MEIYKQIWRKQICRRRHLLPVQPVTLVRTFPLKLLLKMKAKIPILKLPVMIHHQSQKAMQRLSPQEFNDEDKVKADQVVILIKLLKTTTRNGSLVVFARRRKGDWTRTERTIFTVTTNWKLPITKSFATHVLSDSHSTTFCILINCFSRKYATLSYAHFKELDGDKKDKKVAFSVAQKATQEKIIV